MATFPTAISTLAGVLNKRQITPDEAKGIDLKICSQSEAEDELRDRLYGNIDFCERLPYHGLHGEFLDFARYRINYKDAGTWIDREGKVQTYPKYRQMKGLKQQFVYLPKVAGIDWENTIINPAEPLMITEGEYKSVTACKAGIPCVGLGGIWMFNHLGNNLPAPLDQAGWVGKPVIICFDADDQSSVDTPLKPQVAQAALALATKLYRLGAKPELVYIARTKAFAEARTKNAHAKMGLDDFIMAGGDIGELFGTRSDPIQCEDMAILNSQYAVCRGQAGVGVMDIGLGKLYRTHDFTKSIENNRIRISIGPKGGVTKTYVAEEFLEQRDRPTVEQIVFEPAWQVGYDREKAIYNQWTGWPDLGQGGRAEDKREIDNTWRHLIEKLFGEHADYFERWCAHLVQRPGEKTSIGVILVSVLNGVGKSLLGEVLRGVVGETHGRAVPLERLKSNFNSVLERCLFLQMDEANGLQDGLETKLNDLITADKVTIERKGFDAVTVNNYMRIYMTSNSTRPIRVNKENRRWLVIHAGVTAGELADWSSWCGIAAKKLKAPNGLAALRERLERIDLRDWNPTGRVVVTEDMEDMAESSRTWGNVEVDGLMDRCREDWENGKLWFVTSELSASGGGKAIADFKAHVKMNGGQTLKHQAKHNGKKMSGVVIDLEKVLPRKAESAGAGNGTKWALDTAEGLGKFEGAWADAYLRAVKAWNDITTVVKGSDKY
jgi:hypothetical protein